MIQPLRRYHRRAFLLLAVALPVVFVAGLAARRPVVRADAPSDRIDLILPNGTEMITDSRELWGVAVDDPDVLVYWVEDNPSLDALPAGARLLGSLDAGRRGVLHVPHGGRDRGYLLLYSLAHRKPVSRARVPREMP